MKAIVYTKYGPPDVLQLKEVAKPTPKDNEVLVKVHAASVNDWDWGLLRGKPFVIRIGGLFKPKYSILGCDIAGRVEAVGRNATQFQPGDEVFGDISGCSFGGFAEYVCARENVLALKSASMTFEQAAAVPHAGVLFLQGLRDKGQIQKGQKVLINGAGGGVGTMGLQFAKSLGAEVTCVDSGPKLDMLRSLGADHVIDYTKEDFTKNGQAYDLIIDNVVNRSIFDYKRALSPNGIFVMVGGSIARIFKIILLRPLVMRKGSKKISILMHKPNPNDLVYMNELFEAGIVEPIIDKIYPLSEVPEALRYYGKAHHQGKLVITMEHNNKT